MPNEPPLPTVTLHITPYLITIVVADAPYANPLTPNRRDGILDFVPIASYTTYEASLDRALQIATHYINLHLPPPPNSPPPHIPPLATTFSPYRIISPNTTLHRNGQTALALSPAALANLNTQIANYGYNTRGASQGGLTYYLQALLTANPTPACWRDTRPQVLRDYDAGRLARSLFPYWSSATISTDNRRLSRSVSAAHFAKLTPALLQLADHFIIAAFRAGDQTNDTLRAKAVVEAIGLQYLTPIDPPEHNPRRVTHYTHPQPHIVEISF